MCGRRKREESVCLPSAVEGVCGDHRPMQRGGGGPGCEGPMPAACCYRGNFCTTGAQTPSGAGTEGHHRGPNTGAPGLLAAVVRGCASWAGPGSGHSQSVSNARGRWKNPQPPTRQTVSPSSGLQTANVGGFHNDGFLRSLLPLSETGQTYCLLIF